MATDDRQRVLREHAILRVLIKRLCVAANAAAVGGPVQELRDSGRTLHAVFEAHCRAEEALLGTVPIVVSRGGRPLRDLHERHHRALMTLERLRGRGTQQYARAVLRLAPHLLTAIDTEEREFLGSTPAQAPVGGTA